MMLVDNHRTRLVPVWKTVDGGFVAAVESNIYSLPFLEFFSFEIAEELIVGAELVADQVHIGFLELIGTFCTVIEPRRCSSLTVSP